jgi:hypothetical protein
VAEDILVAWAGEAADAVDEAANAVEVLNRMIRGAKPVPIRFA